MSQTMITALESGAEAVLSYDWRFKNLGLDQDDSIWIKTFIRNSAGDHALGWALDKDTLDEDNKDDTNETHWAELPEDVRSVFIQDCSEHFLSAGSYYLDIGAKVGYYTWENSLYEDGVFHFDNVYLRINPLPDIKFTGPADSGFGFGVGYCDKFNHDDYDDIIISAPYYDSPNGNDSGAIFGFFMGPNTDKLRSAEIADFISYGEHADDNFGRRLLGVVSLDSDEFSEIMASAINYDLSSANVGRIYILSITNKPRIRLIYPQGGEVLSGNVTINATATDPDDNIDNSFGVQFYYSIDLDTWTTIGDDKTPTLPNNIYEQTWDTTILPDGSNYYLKCWVRDLYLNTGENISSAVTIDNLHPPKLSIKSPKLGETIEGTIEINAMVKDSSLDIIGGGINTSNGVNFYLSKDKVAWELFGNIHTGTQDEYVTTLETPKYPDGEYWIKVNASDWDGFEVEEMINVTIDNPGRPPSITLLAPLDNEEVSGITVVRATAFDYDGDINSSGITFLISMDTTNKTWQPIGNVPIPVINGTGAHIYSMDWDTTTVPDNWYQLKAYIMDNESFTNE
ncbi:MAG: hypothetical protein KAJ51_08420, partial [Thermoplasmata archaeon]|nr:hypothetical protein [Thermoplasmata archaeon]